MVFSTESLFSDGDTIKASMSIIGESVHMAPDIPHAARDRFVDLSIGSHRMGATVSLRGTASWNVSKHDLSFFPTTVFWNGRLVSGDLGHGGFIPENVTFQLEKREAVNSLLVTITHMTDFLEWVVPMARQCPADEIVVMDKLINATTQQTALDLTKGAVDDKF